MLKKKLLFSPSILITLSVFTDDRKSDELLSQQIDQPNAYVHKIVYKNTGFRRTIISLIQDV